MKYIGAALILITAIGAQSRRKGTYVPPAGFVPDRGTAAAIAEAVLIPIYGREQTISERPFNADLKNEVWIVRGTLHCNGPSGSACPGGVAQVKIAKRTGAILSINHSQ